MNQVSFSNSARNRPVNASISPLSFAIPRRLKSSRSPVGIRPLVQHPARERASVLHPDRLWYSTLTGIAPNGSWEDGYAENFHGRLPDELLNVAVFDGLSDTEMLAARWRQEYNHHRPHSSLGYVPLAIFAITLVRRPEKEMDENPDAVAVLSRLKDSLERSFKDFVIVHELLHLRYSTHGRVFKALLNAYVPGSSKFDVAMGQPAVIVRPLRMAAMSGRNCAT
jgi:hypothetical protein